MAAIDLRFGPYSPPAVRRGEYVACELRGEEVICGGMSAGRIQWPRVLKTGRQSLILCGDLIRAVKSEAEIAVAYHWGVSVTTVWAWRKALDVGRMTKGTTEVYRDLMPQRLPTEAAEKGRATISADPEVRKKMSVARLGKPILPQTRKGLLRAARRKKTKQHREAISKAHRVRKTKPPVSDRAYSQAEIDKLGTATDQLIATGLGRSLHSIRTKRRRLLIPAWTPSTKWKQPVVKKVQKAWTDK